MSERVYCPSCQSMQVAGDIHSCFDAALHVRVKDAERVVIDAAKAYCADRTVANEHELIDAVGALRTLDGGA
jgi:hypothetical protein